MPLRKKRVGAQPEEWQEAGSMKEALSSMMDQSLDSQTANEFVEWGLGKIAPDNYSPRAQGRNRGNIASVGSSDELSGNKFQLKYLAQLMSGEESPPMDEVNMALDGILREGDPAEQMKLVAEAVSGGGRPIDSEGVMKILSNLLAMNGGMISGAMGRM